MWSDLAKKVLSAPGNRDLLQLTHNTVDFNVDVQYKMECPFDVPRLILDIDRVW